MPRTFADVLDSLQNPERDFSSVLDQLSPPAGEGEWENVSPVIQRRKKANGKYEYRPNPGAVPGGKANPPEAAPNPLVALLDGPYGSPTPAGLKKAWEGVRLGAVEGADFLANLPEAAGRAIGVPTVEAFNEIRDRERRAKIAARLQEDRERGVPITAERLAQVERATPRHEAAIPPPAGLSLYGAPEIVDETLQSARDQAAALQEPYTRYAEETFTSPARAAITGYALNAPRVLGNLADPTALGLVGKGGQAVRRLEQEALESGLETAGRRTLKKALGESGAGAIAREAASGRVDDLAEEAAYLARREKALPRVPGGADDRFLQPGSLWGALRSEDEILEVGRHVSRESQEAALGLRAPRGEADELARTSLGIAPEIPPEALPDLPERIGERGSISTSPLSSARDWVVRNFKGGGPQAGQYELAAREFEPGRGGVARALGKGETPAAAVVRSVPGRIEALEGRQAKALQRAQDIIDDATPIVRETAPSKKGQMALWRDLQAASVGDLPIEQIPEPLRPLVARRQELTEALQKRGIDTGAFPDDMVEAIGQSGGKYHHRTYRAFKDPQHYDKVVDTPDWYAARDYLKNELPGATDGEVQDVLLALTKRERGATALTIQQAPTRLNAILRERKNIPPPLRKLMGEELDFRLTTLETVEQLARDIETHNFWKALKEDGLAAQVFRDPDAPAAAGYEGGLWARIPGSNKVEGISSRGPVEGLLTREALRDAIVGQFEPRKVTAANRFAAYVNLGKTVGSFPAGHIRNFAAHHITSAVNGKSPALVYQKAGELRRLFGDPAMRSLRDRAIELGVIGEGASSREVFDFIQTIEEGTVNPLAIGIAKAGKKLGQSWRMGDHVWRAAHWLDEVEQLAWANPGMSRPAVEALAADRVKDTFQTYSRAPEIAAKLRRTPFGGPGVTFHTESVRNVKNIARIAASDIATGIRTGNPRMVALGMRRTAGLMSGPALVASIPAAGRLMSGMDRKQQEAARQEVLPYYHENAEILVTHFEPGKTMTYWDLSFMNPYSSISRSTIAAHRAMEEGQPPAAAIGEFLDQVSGGDIATKELLQLVTNETMGSPWALGDRKGSPLYNLDERAAGKLKYQPAAEDALYHAERGFAPGFVVQGENLLRGAGVLENEGMAGRKRELGQEIAATLGARPSTYDIPKSLRFNLGKKGDRFEEVTREFKKVVPKDPAAMEQRADDYLTSWADLYEETRQAVENYQVLGMSAPAIRSTAAPLRLPAGVLKSALAGSAAPPSPIRLNARGELPESWDTTERRPYALAILRRWRARW